MGLCQVEIRRRNFIPPDAFPYQTPVALQYDSGNYTATLEAASRAADVDGFAARRQQSEANGRPRGLGFSTYLEACGLAPSAVVRSLIARDGLSESAAVRVHPTGSVTEFTGPPSHGLGTKPNFSQLYSAKHGLP